MSKYSKRTVFDVEEWCDCDPKLLAVVLDRLGTKHPNVQISAELVMRIMRYLGAVEYDWNCPEEDRIVLTPFSRANKENRV